ncbi:hypothetical protein [Anaeromyxobacter paludicola]|uniref:Uncharacterized protein n=1 Tax=Anaeromyxobacter paludicola TaxID=2918171 RepID=A0ABM7X500_9BACT|nr:hypothetical protein [Anaeromyxobacter paludicola]BDG06889.1 hypothetical protein AMPC_00020 [Anaeromyxobacter paludicola]
MDGPPSTGRRRTIAAMTSTHTVEMAVVHRPCSAGIDLPAGASADDLAPSDYHVVEMPDATEHHGAIVAWAVVHRPNDTGLDLPAGKGAAELAPGDYRPIEIDDDGGV